MTLAKKLQASNTSKGLVSASRICCRFATSIPSKFSPDVAKILNDNSAHKSTLVRKDTAIALREILLESGPYEFVAINNLKKMIKDPQDTVKVMAIESLCSRQHSRTYFMSSIFNMLLSCIDQKSWRTRFIIIKQMPDILGSVDPKSRRQITGFLFKAINDSELEVAIKALEVSRYLPTLIDADEINEKLLPEFQKAMVNENYEVRKALASSLPYFATHFTKYNEHNSAMKTMIMQLFKDENAEVRVTLFGNLEPYLKAQSVQNTLSNFTTTLQELLNDKSWKVRLDSVKVLEMLITKFPEDVANDEKIIRSLNEKLSDKVSIVRKATIITIKSICSTLGLAWSERHGINLFHSFFNSLNYLYRLNFLYGIAEICKSVSLQSLVKEIDFVTKLAKDPVPNVRIQALITMLRIAQKVEDKSVHDRVKRMADEMSNDSDMEVQKMASKMGSTSAWKALAEQFGTLTIAV
jgi:HEAT repeat protein